MNKWIIVLTLLVSLLGVIEKGRADAIGYSIDGDIALNSKGDDITVGVSNYEFNGINGAENQFNFEPSYFIEDLDDWLVGDRLFHEAIAWKGIDPEFSVDLNIAITNSGTENQSAQLEFDFYSIMLIELYSEGPRDVEMHGLTLLFNDGNPVYFNQDDMVFVQEDYWNTIIHFPLNFLVDVTVAPGETVIVRQTLNGQGIGDFTFVTVPEPGTFGGIAAFFSYLFWKRRRRPIVRQA